MRIHRFIGDFDLHAHRVVISRRDIVHQLRDVLRLRTGEMIVLGNGVGEEAQAKIVLYTKTGCEVEIQNTKKNDNEPVVDVTLYASILKKENFELVIEKATEIGVTQIVPIIARRTVKLAVREARAEKIIREAAEQSGRGVLPRFVKPMKLAEAFGHAAVHDINIFCDPTAPLLEREMRVSNIGIFIGPEGGWDPQEIEEARRAGHVLTSLGGLVLRAETAAIIAVYLAVSGR